MVKIKLIFICTFAVLLYEIAQGQQYVENKIILAYRTMECMDKKFPYSYEFNCFENNTYNLIVNVSCGDDIMTSEIISQGKYTQNKNSVICIDDCYGYKLVFNKKQDTLIAETMFAGLVRYIFKKEKYFEEFSYLESNRKKVADIKLANKNKNKYYALYYGVYSERLKLIPPNIYEYYSYEVLISKGTFKRNGRTNELELFDTELNAVWKLLFIERKKLIDTDGYPINFGMVYGCNSAK